MPDRRRHRGPHPRDAELFAARWVPALRTATSELSWLLSRGYPDRAALELVGDRHGLAARQRTAVRRSACTDEALRVRRGRRVDVESVEHRPVHLDGFNCLIIVESLLSGGVVLRGRDGAHRDLASVHGTYRMVQETPRALEHIGEVLGGSPATWWLDRPVSNSGRLGRLLEEVAGDRGWPWQVEIVPSPDRVLATRGGIVATADAEVLDRCEAWVDLPAAVHARSASDAWVVDLEIDAPGRAQGKASS